MLKPVIISVFANDHEGRPLPKLGKECNDISNILASHPSLKAETIPYATATTIFERMNNPAFKDRIVAFHFAGHADQTRLFFEDENGHPVVADGESLARFLGSKKKLKLVFLNGCATKDLVGILHDSGIPFVIATNRPIGDSIGTDLAIAFYKHIRLDLSIGQAFDTAVDQLNVVDTKLKKEDVKRGSISLDDLEEDTFPWGLHAKSGHNPYTAHIEPDIAQALRDGSRSFFEELRGPKGLYRHIDVSDMLFTTAELQQKKSELIDSILGQTAVEELWDKEISHAAILGDGGMGKTVTLLRLWEQFLEIERPIPIFIAANEFNQAKAENQKHWLKRYILEHYLEEPVPKEENINELWKWICQEWNYQTPKLLLLLDGFNEITVDNQPLINELTNWRQKASGVQILLTSRYTPSMSWTSGFQELKLTPLDKETQIIPYLEKNAKERQWENYADGRFWKVLSNPMMLSIYAKTYRTHEDDEKIEEVNIISEPTSNAEILFNFFEVQLLKNGKIVGFETETFSWYRWLINHLLPFIGYQMNIEGAFNIRRSALRENIQKYWNELGNTQMPWIQTINREAIYRIHEELFPSCLDIWDSWLDEESLRKNIEIIKFIVEGLDLMLEYPEGVYAFPHQSFRDYFAAKYVQDQLKLTVHQNFNLPPESRFFPVCLHGTPLDVYVRQFLGELEKEYTNQIECGDKKWRWSKGKFFLENNLTKLLEQCRGVFDENQLGYTVWNLLTIWKDQRGEFSGADLHQLNFQNFSLNGVLNFRPGLKTSFAQGHLRKENLFSQGHSSRVSSVAYNQDEDRIVSGSWDKTIKVWDTKTGQCLLNIEGHSDCVLSVAYSPDGGRIVSGSQDNTVKVWDAKTGKRLLNLKDHAAPVSSVAYSPDGNRIVSGSRDKTIKVWDAKTGKCLSTLEGHSSGINSVAYSPDGSRIVTGSIDKTVKVWDLQTEDCELTLEDHTQGITSVAYSPDGNRIVSGSWDNIIKVWDAKTGKRLLTVFGHSDQVLSVVYNRDGNRIVSGSRDKTIKVWDAKTGQCLLTLEGLSAVRSVIYTTLRCIVSGSEDKTVKIWDATTGRELLTLEGNSSGVSSVSYSPDGECIVSGSYDRTVKLWDAGKGVCFLTLKGHFDNVRSVACSPEGSRIVSGSWDNIIKVWDAKTGQCLLTLEEHSSAVNSVAYSPDGSCIVSSSSDKTVKVWDAKTGQCLLILEGDSFFGDNVASYSPDGSRIVSGLSNRMPRVWDAKTGQCLLTLEGHLDLVISVAYSPDGSRIVSSSWDRTVKVWDGATGQCLLTLEGHKSRVNSVAYSPDGSRIISSSWDKTVKVWDANTGQCIFNLEGDLDRVYSLAYSPDGSCIVGGSQDHIKLWNTKENWFLKYLLWNRRFSYLTLPNIPGLFIQGCDFRNLHPDSKLSKKEINLLRQYGAIFKDKDAQRWKKLMKMHLDIPE